MFCVRVWLPAGSRASTVWVRRSKRERFYTFMCACACVRANVCMHTTCACTRAHTHMPTRPHALSLSVSLMRTLTHTLSHTQVNLDHLKAYNAELHDKLREEPATLMPLFELAAKQACQFVSWLNIVSRHTKYCVGSM